MEIKNICINKSSKLISAVEMIKNSGCRCIIIVNNNGIAIGTLSEGDILEGILKGQSIYSTISNFLNRNFTYITEEKRKTSKGQKYVLDNFRKGLTIIPILDKKGKPLDYIDYRDFI